MNKSFKKYYHREIGVTQVEWPFVKGTSLFQTLRKAIKKPLCEVRIR
jgi:hypothetical protein